MPKPKKKSKSHVKPTKEELDDTVQAAIDAEPPEDESVNEPVPLDPESSSLESDEQADPSEEAKTKLKEEIKSKKKEISASARENQKIYAKNRVLNKAIIDAEDAPDPTEGELKAEFTDWDVMSDTEKKFAKETVVSRNWRESISKAKEQAKKIEKWNESVTTFVDNPKTLIANPELEGKAEEFKVFATQETNNSVPFSILVGAFLHENSSSRTPNKGRMFETGSGGPNEKPQPKSGKVTLEEAKRIKKVDYKKYKELLMAGKIEMNI